MRILSFLVQAVRTATTATREFFHGFISRRGSPRADLLDALEPRLLLAAVSWAGGNGNNWFNDANWGGNVTPQNGGGNNYDVTVAINATINLNDAPTITSLTVDNGATVTIERGTKALTIGTLRVQAGASLTINNGGGADLTLPVIDVADQANQTGHLTLSSDATSGNLVVASFINVGTGAGSAGTLSLLGANTVVDASAVGPVMFGDGGTAQVLVDGAGLKAINLTLQNGGIGQGAGATNLSASSLTVQNGGRISFLGTDGFTAGDDAHGIVWVTVDGGIIAPLPTITTKTTMHGVYVNITENGTLATSGLTLQADSAVLVESALLHSKSTTFDGGDALDVTFSSGIWWDDGVDGPIGAALQGGGEFTEAMLADWDGGIIAPGDGYQFDEDGHLVANASPENPNGTLTFDGDLDVSGGDLALYSVVDSSGASQLNVTGTATLGGDLEGQISVLIQGGDTWQTVSGDTWELLRAGTISGTFGDVSWNTPFDGAILGLPSGSYCKISVVTDGGYDHLMLTRKFGLYGADPDYFSVLSNAVATLEWVGSDFGGPSSSIFQSAAIYGTGVLYSPTLVITSISDTAVTWEKTVSGVHYELHIYATGGNWWKITDSNTGEYYRVDGFSADAYGGGGGTVSWLSNLGGSGSGDAADLGCEWDPVTL